MFLGGDRERGGAFAKVGSDPARKSASLNRVQSNQTSLCLNERMTKCGALCALCQAMTYWAYVRTLWLSPLFEEAQLHCAAADSSQSVYKHKPRAAAASQQSVCSSDHVVLRVACIYNELELARGRQC